MKLSHTTLIAMAALAAATAHANPPERMVRSALQLQQLEDTDFKGAKPDTVKALRAEYKAAAAAAQTLARANVARLSAGKRPEEVDKALREADRQAGTPAKVLAVIDGMGGPYKALQQTDAVFADFNRQVLSGSQKFAVELSAERLLMLALGVGQAQARTIMKAGSTRCYFLMWVTRQSTQTAYDNCG